MQALAFSIAAGAGAAYLYLVMRDEDLATRQDGDKGLSLQNSRLTVQDVVDGVRQQQPSLFPSANMTKNKDIPLRYLSGEAGRNPSNKKRLLYHENEWTQMNAYDVLKFGQDWWKRNDDELDMNKRFQFQPGRPSHKELIHSAALYNPRAPRALPSNVEPLQATA